MVESNCNMQSELIFKASKPLPVFLYLYLTSFSMHQMACKEMSEYLNLSQYGQTLNRGHPFQEMSKFHEGH